MIQVARQVFAWGDHGISGILVVDSDPKSETEILFSSAKKGTQNSANPSVLRFGINVLARVKEISEL